MTNHINHRTLIDQPSTDTSTAKSTTTVPPSIGAPPRSSPDGRGRNTVSTVGIILGAAAVVGLGALLVDAVTGSDQNPAVELTDATTSQQLVEQSIADAVAQRSVAGATVRGDFTTSQQLVEQSIADAVAQRSVAGATVRGDFTTSQQLVEQSIADAVAQRSSSSYDRVEANRAGVLSDLAGVQPSSYDRVEANRAAVLGDLADPPAADAEPAIRGDFTTAQQLVGQSIADALAE